MVQPGASVSIFEIPLVSSSRRSCVLDLCLRRLIPSGCSLSWAYLLEPKQPQGIALIPRRRPGLTVATATGVEGRDRRSANPPRLGVRANPRAVCTLLQRDRVFG